VSACYHSVQKVPISYPRLYRVKYTEIKFCVLFSVGVKLRLFTLREELRLRMFENRLPRKIFVCKGKKTEATVKYLVMIFLMLCASY
jgi:hypothetical protein